VVDDFFRQLEDTLKAKKEKGQTHGRTVPGEAFSEKCGIDNFGLCTHKNYMRNFIAVSQPSM